MELEQTVDLSASRNIRVERLCAGLYFKYGRHAACLYENPRRAVIRLPRFDLSLYTRIKKSKLWNQGTHTTFHSHIDSCFVMNVTGFE